MPGALGRNTPTDFSHITASPLSEIELTTFKPVTIGIPWYTAFDNPHQASDGSYHLADCSRESLGTVRGGHCICLPHMGGQKLVERFTHWWTFYNQGAEGACEGFGHAKAQSLEAGDGRTFDAWAIYDNARKLEGTFPNGEGTTNHSATQALQKYGAVEQTGAVCTRGAHDGSTHPVSNVRWTTDAEEVLAALGRLNAHAVPLSNNWGNQYPPIVWLPVTTLARVLSEEGEADVVTDR